METLKRLKLQQIEDKRRIMAKKKQDLNTEKKRKSNIRREQVLQRKTTVGKQNQTLMQLVGNKDNVWDLIGQEEKFKDQASFIENDLIKLEKRQLKNDSLFLNKIISFDGEGKMQVNLQDPMDYATLQNMLKNKEYLENSTDSKSEGDSVEEMLSNKSGQIQYKFRNIQVPNDEERSVSSLV